MPCMYILALGRSYERGPIKTWLKSETAPGKYLVTTVKASRILRLNVDSPAH